MASKWIESDITANHVRIHYTRTGRGDKPPLVLLHGFTDIGKCWTPVARDLEVDYDLILPDARGHGLSERLQAGVAVDMAADTAEMIKALGLEQPVVGGHSMGASVAAELGGRFGGLVRALILEDPPWFSQSPRDSEAEPERPNPFQEWLMAMKNMSVEELVNQCRAMNPTWQDAELHPWAESKTQFDYSYLQSEQIPRMEWKEAVRAIVRPTLLITADPEKGAIVTQAIARKAAKMNNFIHVAQMSGAGHNIRRENYSDYMKTVRSFLKEIGW